MRSEKPNPEHDDIREAVLRKIRVDIGKLDADSTFEAVAEIIERIAAADLDSVTREFLIKTIKQQTGISIAAVREQIAEALKKRRRAARAPGGEQGLILNEDGGILALEANAATIVRQKLPGLFALDDFRQMPMLMSDPPWVRPGETFPRPITDADDAALLSWVQRQGVHLRGKPAIKTVMSEIISDAVFHPVRDYLTGIQWDGEKRLDRWLSTYLGVKDIPNYTTVVGSKWMISAVARIFVPGCTCKYCLLLLGKQDLGKSEALAILGGEFFTDDIAELGTKDSAMQNAGVWIVELAELASVRRGDLETIKAFISRKVDRFRPPYGTHVIARPRQNVLAGTVNPSDAFLKDDTGNVRYWPNTCTGINFVALRRDRDQLWAEAAHRFRDGEHWWIEDDSAIDAARTEQAAHSETAEDHPWFSIIEQWLHDEQKLVYEGHPKARLRQSDNSFVFPISEVLERLDIPKDRWTDQRISTQIGKILRHLGWKSGGVRLASFEEGGKDAPVRRWNRIDHTCNRRNQDGTRCSVALPPPDHRCPIHAGREPRF